MTRNSKLVVSHAGIRGAYIGKTSARVREFCLYGDTDGETDELGLPIRRDWAKDYRRKSMIVYGHTPEEAVRSINHTYCIDTGCVFGGTLSCLRYPEMEIVSVKAKKRYYEPIRKVSEKKRRDTELLKVSDVLGKRRIETALIGTVTINEEKSAAAFEKMSRFGIDPKWMIYLPPTMSPCETAQKVTFGRTFRRNGYALTRS